MSDTDIEHARASAGMAPEGTVHSWAGGATYTDITLDPGTYVLVGIDHVELIVEHVPEGPPIWLGTDADGPTHEPARVVTLPVEGNQTLVVTKPTEFRIHRNVGHSAILKPE